VPNTALTDCTRKGKGLA